MRTHAISLWSALALCACSASVTIGRKFNTAHVTDIRLCVTTEEDLVAWFGEPFTWGNENGFPAMHWSYVHTAATFGGKTPDSELQSLAVILNKDGKVVHFQLNPTNAPAEVKDVCAVPDDAGADAGPR